MLHNGSKLLATDMDDVLVHISTPWVLRALARPRLLEAWGEGARRVAALPDLTNRIVERPYPHLQQWLEDDMGMPKSLRGEVDLAYRADPAFYDELPPTVICQGIMAALALPGRISHVHVVTHNFSNSDPVVEGKERWLRRHLGGPERVTIHHLDASQKKSDVLKQFCPEPDSFADDAMKNVVDVLLNDRVRPREILIPQMGHNIADPEVVRLAALRRIKLTYYDTVL